jgi:superfamily I DNA/RNA helicase
VAVLYRLNSQSRVHRGPAHARRHAPTSIIGGVRFYERKEIKDALAYPEAHREPARRRQLPSRDQRALRAASARCVMDTLEADEPGQAHAAPPLVAAGLYEIASARSLWAGTGGGGRASPARRARTRL